MADTIKASKRGRGRPKGTGKPDQAALQQIADLLLHNPAMRHTTAIKRIIGTANPSAIRRLQVKWKEHGPRLRGEAQQRRQRRRTPAAAPVSVRDYAPIARAVIDRESFSAASQMRPFFDNFGSIAAAERAALGTSLAAIERDISPVRSLQAEIGCMQSPVLDAHARIEGIMDPVTAAAREARAGIEQMMAPIGASDVRAAIQHMSTTHPAIASEMRGIMEQITPPALSLDTRALMPPILSLDTRALMPPTLADPASEAQRLNEAMSLPAWRRLVGIG